MRCELFQSSKKWWIIYPRVETTPELELANAFGVKIQTAPVPAISIYHAQAQVLVFLWSAQNLKETTAR